VGCARRAGTRTQPFSVLVESQSMSPPSGKRPDSSSTYNRSLTSSGTAAPLRPMEASHAPSASSLPASNVSSLGSSADSRQNTCGLPFRSTLKLAVQPARASCSTGSEAAATASSPSPSCTKRAPPSMRQNRRAHSPPLRARRKARPREGSACSRKPRWPAVPDCGRGAPRHQTTDNSQPHKTRRSCCYAAVWPSAPPSPASPPFTPAYLTAHACTNHVAICPSACARLDLPSRCRRRDSNHTELGELSRTVHLVHTVGVYLQEAVQRRRGALSVGVLVHGQSSRQPREVYYDKGRGGGRPKIFRLRLERLRLRLKGVGVAALRSPLQSLDGRQCPRMLRVGGGRVLPHRMQRARGLFGRHPLAGGGRVGQRDPFQRALAGS
jgi:hypothetical protein